MSRFKSSRNTNSFASALRQAGISLLFILLSFSSAQAQTESSSALLKEWLKLKHAGWQAEIDERFDDAKRSYEKALVTAEKVGTHSPQVEETLVRLANVAILRGDLNQAEVYYSRVLGVVARNKREGKLDREALVWLEDLADTYEIIGVKTDPLRSLQHSADIRQFTHNPKLKGTLEKLIRVHTSLGQPELAYDLIKRAIKIDRKLPSGEGRDMGLGCNLTLFSAMEIDRNRWKEAEQAADEALPLVSNAKKKDKLQFLAESSCRTVRATIFTNKGEYAKAQSELALAEPLLIASGVGGSYLEDPFLIAHARLALKQKNGRVAQRWLEKDVSLIEKYPTTLTQATIKKMMPLFDELKKSGQPEAAAKLKKRLSAMIKPPSKTITKAAHK